jgi:hypothetical protein
MEIIFLVVGGGLYWLGWRNGAHAARVDFTHTTWMGDATDEQRQRFIANVQGSWAPPAE